MTHNFRCNCMTLLKPAFPVSLITPRLNIFVEYLCKFEALLETVLKGQSHEIFDPRFFSSINTYGPPDLWVKAVSILNSYSRRYSIFSLSYPKIFCFILQTIGKEDPLRINF
jgi:hypothetical protein